MHVTKESGVVLTCSAMAYFDGVFITGQVLIFTQQNKDNNSFVKLTPMANLSLTQTTNKIIITLSLRLNIGVMI